MLDCCKHTNKTKKCIRKDKKIFSLPRKFSKKKCLTSHIKGFSMRSSCAPYNLCKRFKKNNTRKKDKTPTFLFNNDNPKTSFDVYIDKDPSDTIHIKYATLDDVKNTINKLEKLYKTNKYSHKRIWQVAMILRVRLGVLNKYRDTKYKNAKEIKKRYELANKYFTFLKKRTNENDENKRKNFIFKI